ncbi:prephenate dehydratase [Lactococcus piscium]|uniref:prephenate dehydratase n=1 Tax=Pseudolactococcus carnosus TaxID=2749961 RepID=UPI001FBB82B0|nr:prephenate dehydratase [Lactococcus carnosus]MCJ1972577.1 prephenate dehydratase [Lactococcus carnosus]MCJ1976082.1 prephenate dehydratase [Lactococcus carnosus]MCJ1986328.1 prephenate dehydratase [Lactococcus carnosus]MCJ1991322.1 prephenate dehydratase [Lactococcus carnosus]
MKIGYLGPKASFTYAAAYAAFSESHHTLIPFDTITEVIKNYETGLVDFAIVPVENSIEGSVHQTVDYLYLHADNIRAQAEIVQPIKQQLMATDSTKRIDKIFSHPQAIAQSLKYLQAHFPEAKIESTDSTAYAAQFVAAHPDKPFAAIAPVASSLEYDLTIIAYDIQEIDENYTRFWILGKTRPQIKLPVSDQKITLALTLTDNQPGALYKALKIFSDFGINLSKIESRPLKTFLGEYFFLVDAVYSGDYIYLINSLEKLGVTVKQLGKYKVYKM